MGYTINGIGTEYLPGAGFVSWGGEEISDGYQCFVFFHMPLVPYKAVHTYDWRGNQYRMVPIQGSPGLIARTMARRWLWLPMIGGGVALLFTAIELADRGLSTRALARVTTPLGVGLAAIALAWLGWKWLAKINARDADIRRVLGPHSLGTSDIATWTPELLKALKPASEAYGAATYAAAVPELLAAGRLSDAMWAARSAVALEDKPRGERATDQVLQHPAVRRALDAVRADPQKWRGVMTPAPADGGEGPAA